MGRIFLFGSAVVSVLLLTLIYAIVSGQYAARQPVASPTPGSAAASASVNASASVEPSVSASAEPSASASGTAVVVMISKSSFGPDLTIAAGTTVTFMNNDAFKHTASHGTDGILAADSLFDLQLEGGASGNYMFTDPGTYQITCIIHPTMNMTITVQ